MTRPAGDKKPDLCEHEAWDDVAGGGRRCADCHASLPDLQKRGGTKPDLAVSVVAAFWWDCTNRDEHHYEVATPDAAMVLCLRPLLDAALAEAREEGRVECSVSAHHTLETEAAVARERERCAKIAEAHGTRIPYARNRAIEGTSRQIAAAIRETPR